MTNQPSTKELQKLVTSEQFIANPDSKPHIQVFAGGTCNILRADGRLVRNDGRDDLHDLMNTRDISFYDPQIDPFTHGREYDWQIDGPVETDARRLSDIVLLEISSLTSGLVTLQELFEQYYVADNMTVVWVRPGAYEYIPEGIGSFAEIKANQDLRRILGERMYQHVLNTIKDANRAWSYISLLIQEREDFRIVETEDPNVVFQVIQELLSMQKTRRYRVRNFFKKFLKKLAERI